MNFKSTGKLRYSVKRESSDQNWWVVLDCDPSIGTYYRHLYKLHHNHCRKLQRPFWGAHITVLRNEEPGDQYKPLWGKYAGEEIIFTYRPGVSDNFGPERYRSFYWLDVVCPRVTEIRQELGLEKPECDLHLTIGSYENPDRYEWYLENFKRYGLMPE